MQNEIQFQYTEADFRSFMTYHYRKGAGRKTIYVLVGFVLLISLWPVWKAGFSLFSVATTLFWMVFMLGIWYLTLRFTTSRVFKSNTQLLEPRRFSFDDNGIVMKGETFSSDYKWEGFLRVVETATGFLLFTSNVSAVILPKRIFNATQMEAFRKAAALV